MSRSVPSSVFMEKCRYIIRTVWTLAYSTRPQKLVTTGSARILNYFNSIFDLCPCFFSSKYEKKSVWLFVSGFYLHLAVVSLIFQLEKYK